jgi:hypothetical protein
MMRRIHIETPLLVLAALALLAFNLFGHGR